MSRSATAWPLAFALLVSLAGCEPEHQVPEGDSHTNWLRSCDKDSECGPLSCVCGVCTSPCSADNSCGDAPGSTCVPADHAGVVAMCGGKPAPVAGMCLPSCADVSCAAGQACVAGVCQPQTAPGTQVSIDTSAPAQRLTGFGATVGYAEDQIAQFDEAARLDDAMFAGLGLDVLRFRNRYGEVGDSGLAQAAQIVADATASLGRAPLVLLGSWSPPGYLKQNASTFCGTNAATCTLTKTAGGGFDYAGLATHWKNSLDAYARVGFVPDYIGIQNNPDWTPSGGSVFEACRFLPTEGSVNLLVDGASVAVEYPGYKQALAAVRGVLADLASPPRLLAPDLSGIFGANDYLKQLDPTQIDAVAHHLYGTNPANVDLGSLQTLATLGGNMGVPLFQTEMQAGGFDTAVLIHHTLVEGGASMYLQTALVGPLSGPAVNPTALIGLEGDKIVLQDAYFAMSHFSRFTDPGWSRVGASVTTPSLLASAWLAPDQSALTVVLVNTADQTQTASLDVNGEAFHSARLYRSVFGGSERFADLGSWPVDGRVPLPPRSVATVVLLP